ncbi:MAG: TIGR00296 family protein [Candidatus Heimdallarchaeota archaeon]
MTQEDNIQDYSHEEGSYLIHLARKSILNYLTFGEVLSQPADTLPSLMAESGVFVTLQKITPNGGKNLRGCIGFPMPNYPLIQATILAAKSAAVGDPRFPPVTVQEMNDIAIEVSILTQPIELEVDDPKDYLQKIKIGRDGLIARRGGRSGLLLPQVPVDWEWDVEEFLEHTCNKAGLPGDCWQNKETIILRFSGIIYEEEEPNGEIKRKEI